MAGSVSGHVYRFEGKRRPVWRAKYRLPDGRQVKKTLGPAWTARGRPPAGYYTRRTAETWLRLTLAKAADGTLPGMVSTGVAVADACAGYLRYIEQDRSRKPSTLRDYASIFRNHVLPHLGDLRLEDLTPDRVERWAATEIDPNRRMANRTREKTITVFHGVMERARALPPAGEPGRGRREATNGVTDGDPGLLARGGDGARSSGRRRSGCRDLPHGGVYGHAPGRAPRAAMARRRLPRLGDPRPDELHERASDVAEVRQGPLGPDGAEGRRDARPCRATRAFRRRGRPGVPRDHRRPSRRFGAIARRSSSPGCVRCASTTSGIRSARASLVSPTYGGSRSGWDTRTSRRRCSTSTTCRGPRMPHSLAKRSISARTVVEAGEKVTGSTRTSGGSSESQRISETRSMGLIAPLLHHAKAKAACSGINLADVTVVHRHCI